MRDRGRRRRHRISKPKASGTEARSVNASPPWMTSSGDRSFLEVAGECLIRPVRRGSQRCRARRGERGRHRRRLRSRDRTRSAATASVNRNEDRKSEQRRVAGRTDSWIPRKQIERVDHGFAEVNGYVEAGFDEGLIHGVVEVPLRARTDDDDKTPLRHLNGRSRRASHGGPSSPFSSRPRAHGCGRGTHRGTRHRRPVPVRR